MHEKKLQTAKGTVTYWTNDFNSAVSTLVFLPGLTADHRLFDLQVRAFEDRYNVLVWDAPGHGKSRPFELTFSLADKADYLHRILLAENIKKPFFIGQSMGGYVSQAYMSRYPNSLAGFISIDSAPLKRCYITKAELWLLKRTGLIYRPYSWKALKKAGSKGVAVTEYGRNLMLEMMNDYSKKEYCDLTVHGFKILAEAMEKDLQYEIDCPCLLLCGEQDRAGSSKRYNKNWSEREGLPLIWLEKAGHNSNTDVPRQVNEIIEKFVADNFSG